ncbi:TRAP transporter substrate-binding protein [Wenxinia marina]|uniref:Wenxma_12, whole genome shotgun sequence n=1 Tax=Wenxinia marina DSM 24838 TaxID=1123501 RepID=A0A0D0Q2B2_9RHOB|nr:TRAP transporter substrate-binding protein [Wenxinia marina]KIQ68654.1 TRAP-type C4-dicarboxylate transport system, periplasmic component [Wenxinia marina DSM 24838]GGL67693.1 C4-dicarboxylate ABC transporter substrate-binding protein [Wenxinia marina]
MTPMLRRLAATATAAALLAGPAMAETLKLAHWVPPQHVLTSSTIEPLQAAVEGSGLEIEVYPGGELGAGPLEQYIRAVQGVADITWGLQGYTSSQFPRTMLSELPGALPEGMNGYDLIWNAYEAGQLADEFPGTVPLALWLSEPNIFIMKDIDVRTPEDLQGLKIRVSGSAAAATIEALGATPVQMPAGEIYNALQTGLIDGVVTGASAVADFRLDEVANSYTIGAPLGRISFYLVMNEARYNALPEAERTALDSIAGRALSQSAEEGWNARALETLDALEATGDNDVYYLSDEEAAAFGELTLPVTEQIVGSVDEGQMVLDTMQGM